MEIVAVAAVGMNAIGKIAEGNARAASYRSQAQADDYNAQVSQDRARTALEQGFAREEMQRWQARGFLGRQRASFAQSGFDPSSGTAALVQREDFEQAELDALMTRYEAQLQSRGLNQQAELYRHQARANRSNASSARIAGYLGATSSILGGVASYGMGSGRG